MTASTSQAPMSSSNAAPNTNTPTRTIPNTPALTTATACSNAETGVGATIALGSQLCNGITPAFTPTPPASSTNSPHCVALSNSTPPRNPPAVNVASTPSTCSHAVAPMSIRPPERVYARYLRPATSAVSVSRCVTSGYVKSESSS